MNSSMNEQGLELLHKGKILEFNEFRLKNLTLKPNLSEQDFSKKNLSDAFLNGAICIKTNFSSCILRKVNLVQSELNNANFELADLTDGLFLYSEMKECNLKKCNMKRTNFMWANLQNADLRGSNLIATIFIEANLQGSNLTDLNRDSAYIKYSKIENTKWRNL